MPLVQRRSAAAASERTASRRTAAPADDEGDDDRPARRGATRPTFRGPRDEDDDDKPRRSRDADDDGFKDEDDEERPRGRRGGGGASDAVKSGWGAAKKLKEEGGDYANEFKFDRDPVLVKFMGDAPFAVYKQHWIEGLRSTKKKSFICMGKGCPLCNIGEGASKKWAFNVALIGEDESEVKALIAGSRLFDDIADEHEQNNGIDNGYYALSKSGKKQSTTYKVKLVKERDLEEDWGITPEDAEDSLKGLQPYTAEQFKPQSRSYLQEIADELVGADD